MTYLHGNLFAVATIGYAAAVVLLLVNKAKRPIRLLSVLVGLILMLMSLMCYFSITAFHMCDSGGPVTASFIYALCTFLLASMIPNFKSRIWIVSVSIGAGIGFMLWGTTIVHLPGYTGNPSYTESRAIADGHSISTLKQLLLLDSTNQLNQTISEGWFEDVITDETGSNTWLHSFYFPDHYPKRFWHTWFTGIYKIDNKAFGLWSPGGNYSNAVEGLILKTR